MLNDHKLSTLIALFEARGAGRDETAELNAVLVADHYLNVLRNNKLHIATRSCSVH